MSQAYDGLGDTWRLWSEAYGRNSLDTSGLPLVATVHYGCRKDNAFWYGTQMVFGDGDGVVFLGFTRSLDAGSGGVHINSGIPNNTNWPTPRSSATGSAPTPSATPWPAPTRTWRSTSPSRPSRTRFAGCSSGRCLPSAEAADLGLRPSDSGGRCGRSAGGLRARGPGRLRARGPGGSRLGIAVA